MRTCFLRTLPSIALFGLSVAFAGPLQDAAKSGDLAQVEALLEKGVDINASEGIGTALHWSIFLGHANVTQRVLERGANANAGGTLGTPLHINAMKGDAHITGLLLKHGANPNAARPNGMTPLHAAARGGHIDMARQLIDHGADVNALDANMEPPLHLAKTQGHAALAKLLKAHGAAPPKVAPISELLKSASVANGETKVSVCTVCHRLERNAPVGGDFLIEGPRLWNVVNRPKARVDDYTTYSSALQAEKGTWTYEDLNAFLAHPAVTIPGTRMKYTGLPDPQDRADVIVFLRSLSDDPAPLP